MFMKRFAFFVVALLCVTISARADEAPRFEAFAGYSYGQFNPGGRLVDGSNLGGRHFALSGWHAAGRVKVYKWVGIVVDLSGYAGTSDVELVPEHSRYNAYLAGPQVNIRKFGRTISLFTASSELRGNAFS